MEGRHAVSRDENLTAYGFYDLGGVLEAERDKDATAEDMRDAAIRLQAAIDESIEAHDSRLWCELGWKALPLHSKPSGRLRAV